jgi:hypothetical protein
MSRPGASKEFSGGEFFGSFFPHRKNEQVHIVYLLFNACL